MGKALDMAGGMASERSRSALASVRGPLAVYQRRGVPGDTISRMTGTALPPASTPTPCSSPPSSSTTWPCRAGAPAAAPAGSKFAPLHWDLPSGKADKGESVTDAAARELKEETGLTVDPTTLRIAGIIHGA